MRFSGSAQNRRAAFGRQDAEFEQLKKERDELLIRERAARAEAEESRERLREVLESFGDAFAELVEGAVRLSSIPGTGTKVEASVPLNANRGGR